MGGERRAEATAATTKKINEIKFPDINIRILESANGFLACMCVCVCVRTIVERRQICLYSHTRQPYKLWWYAPNYYSSNTQHTDISRMPRTKQKQSKMWEKKRSKRSGETLQSTKISAIIRAYNERRKKTFCEFIRQRPATQTILDPISWVCVVCVCVCVLFLASNSCEYLSTCVAWYMSVCVYMCLCGSLCVSEYYCT